MFGLTVCLITGDRAPLILFLMTIGLFVIFEKKLRKYIIPISLLLMVILSFFILFEKSLNGRYFKFVDNLLNKKSISVNKSNSITKVKNVYLDTQWGAHFLAAKEMYKENKLFGKGFNSFRIICWNYYYIKSNSSQTRCSQHPHNFYIQLMSEVGIIGLGLYLFFFLFIFAEIRNIRHFNYKSQTIFMYILFFALIFPLKPTGSIFSTLNNSMLFYIIGWLMYLTGNKIYKNE